MNLDQLHYIMEIKRHGSITKAANALFMTQSALSMALTALEKELNVAIFQRTKSGVVPTKQGKEILRYADEILGKLEELQLYAKQCNANLQETIKIVIGPLIYGTILLDVIGAVQEISQDIFLDIHELEARAIRNFKDEIFMDQKADFLFWGCQDFESPFYEAQAHANGLTCQWLAASQLTVYLRRGHPLLTLPRIELESLEPYTLMATSALKTEIEKRYQGTYNYHIYPINTFYNIEQLLLKKDFILIAQSFFGHKNPHLAAGELVALSTLNFDIGPQRMRYMLLFPTNHINTPGEEIFIRCLQNLCHQL